MTALHLRAHFDGKVFQPDEPVNLPPGTSLLLTILAPGTNDHRPGDDPIWNELALKSFEAAGYGPNEPGYGTIELLRMKEGDVLLAAFPQADRTHKRRPAIVLKIVPPLGDAVVCAVSSQTDFLIESLEELISPSDEDFKSSNLRAASRIRTAVLTTLPKSFVVGRIGIISQQRTMQLKHRLAGFLGSQS